MEPYAGFEPQVGEIRALRTFRVGPGGALYPLFGAAPWADGANRARCRLVRPGPADGHRAPVPSCSCGFYAYGSEQAAGEHPHADHVLAVVACWGRVIAGTRGVRAELARIEALWFSAGVPAELAAATAERYRSAAIYCDKAEMLAEHPLTALDCYEPVPLRRSRFSRAGLLVASPVALALTAAPGLWWPGSIDDRLLWTALLGLLVIAAVITGRDVPTDLAARRRRVLVGAAALWVSAPLAGPVGIVLMRVPLLQLAALVLVHHRRLRRAANRFPAVIEPA